MSNDTLNTAYQGLVCTAVTDRGPELLYDYSVLDEAISHMLAIQALTMISMGSGSEGGHGPIPVPKNPELQALVYTFFAPAPDSQDDRVRLHGRQYAFFLIFSKDLHYTDQLNKYTANFLKNELENYQVTEDIVREIHEQIKTSVIYSIDQVSLLTNQVKALTERIKALEDLKYQLEDIVKEILPGNENLVTKITKLVESQKKSK